MNIKQIVKQIFERGPDRMMIGPYEATSLKRSRISDPIIIFIRDDGWSLAAPREFELDAFNTWADKWTHFVLKPEKKARPISEYEYEREIK